MKENLLRKHFWGGRPLFKGAIVAIATLILLATSDIAFPQSAAAYPFWAQQNYENPREATGRIVCANCHLAAKPTKLEVPQSVLPDTVFKAVVEIPYKDGTEQLLGDGSKGGLNVGAVVVLPDGYELAPADRIPEDIQEETEGVFYQKYSEERDNIILVGPLPGDEHREIVFPVLSPDPDTNKSVSFGKSLIYAGGNRGRGQVYPTGEQSNNNPVVATAAGTVSDVAEADGGYRITVQPEEGKAVSTLIPAGLDLVVSEGDTVDVGTLLTEDPNVGGFGQADAEIVLQSSARIKGLLAFFFAAMLTQIMLVLKKKQVEKVQAAEML